MNRELRMMKQRTTNICPYGGGNEFIRAGSAQFAIRNPHFAIFPNSSLTYHSPSLSLSVSKSLSFTLS